MNDAIKNYVRDGSINYSHAEEPWLITSSNDAQITYTTIPKIDIQNIEVTQELMDELSKLIMTGNVSLSLRGVTLKEKIKEYPTKVTKPKSQETEISNKEFNEVITLLKNEEEYRKQKDKEWKQINNDDIGLLNDNLFSFDEGLPEENLLDLIEESQVIPKANIVGDEPLPIIIENIDGKKPENNDILKVKLDQYQHIKNSKLSTVEEIELEQYKDNEINRMKRERLEILREKYKYKL